jgi:UDP:flavonoid glycosyltransferase YjiC (YdhE family)
VARVLLAWEFGGDLGHVRRAIGIARRLLGRGHEPTLAFGDLGSLALAEENGIEAVQAPLLPRPRSPNPSPLNASDILLNLGFEDAKALAGALRAWDGLLRLLQPRLLVADYAPTALLAARLAGLPRIAVGSGFSTPPTGDPMPSMRPWADCDTALLANRDGRLLSSVREALRRSAPQAAPPALAAELFDADARLLCTWPEFDPFGPRGDVEYLGPQPDESPALPVTWETPARPRIFAYLKPRDERFARLVAAIGATAGEAIVAAPGMGAEHAAAASRTGMRILDAPVALDRVLPGADLCVSHGGPGIAAAAAARGVRQAFLPMHLEQYLVARNCARAGLGVAPDPDDRDPDLGRWLGTALTLAPRPPQVRTPTSVATRIESLLGA